MTPRLLVIGDSTIDHFMTLDPAEAEPQCELRTHECKLLIPYGEKLPAERYDEVIAGCAPNVAVAAARFELGSHICSVMGNDAIGQRAKEYLMKEGVDVTHLQLVEGEHSNVSVVLRVLQERTIIVYHYPRTYRLPSLDQSGWIYLCSMAKGWEVILQPLVAQLKKTGAKLVFQPGTHQLRSGHVITGDLLHTTELFICNREEAAEYLNHGSDASIRQLLVGLHALGPKLVIITDGHQGSYASDGQRHWFLGSRADIERVEATGAGDAYASGVTAALIHGETLPEAMRWGNVNAESVIGFIGAQAGILKRDELIKRLADPKCLVAEPYNG